MEQLKKERDKRGLLERTIVGFWEKKEAEKQRRNDNLAATEGILDLKYQSDYQLLFGLFLEWLDKSKTKEQREKLNLTINALFRIGSYVSTLQTVSREAVGEMLDEQRTNNGLKTDIQNLKKQVKSLKAEIEHYEQQ